MHIATIRYFLEELNISHGWLDPWLISGVNIGKSRIWNYRVYACQEELEDEMVDDRVIVEYLSMLRWNSRDNLRGVFGVRVVEAAVYLIQCMWSVAAEVWLPHWNDRIKMDEINNCISIVKKAYLRAEFFPKALLRDFSLSMFEFEKEHLIYKWKDTISLENFAFLSELYNTMPPNFHRQKAIPKNPYSSEKDTANISYSIALNPNASKQVLAELAHHEDNLIRRIVAVHPNTSQETLIMLAYDTDIWVKLALLDNSNTPQEYKQRITEKLNKGCVIINIS